jgi:hypothetical protein
MNLLGVSTAALMLTSCVSWPYTYESHEDEVADSFERAQRTNGVSEQALCLVLSDEACNQFFSDTMFRGKTVKAISRSDIILLQNFTSVDVSDVDALLQKSKTNAEMQGLNVSGTNLGIKLGRAVESTRVQQVISDFADLFDRVFRFDLLMLETAEGRIIVPPIIDRSDQTTRVSDDGRQIRIVDLLFVIRQNARFSISSPNWRSYLMAPVQRPTEYDLINAVLPENAEELAYWRDKVVEGYLTGIDLAHMEIERRQNLLQSDFLGMQRYHLLRTYNMVSDPILTSDRYVASGTRDGLSLALDDANISIEVSPLMITQAKMHRAIPNIRNFERFAIDDALLPIREWKYEYQ